MSRYFGIFNSSPASNLVSWRCPSVLWISHAGVVSWNTALAPNIHRSFCGLFMEISNSQQVWQCQNVLYSFSLVLSKSRDFQMQLSDFCIALRCSIIITVSYYCSVLLDRCCFFGQYVCVLCLVDQLVWLVSGRAGTVIFSVVFSGWQSNAHFKIISFKTVGKWMCWYFTTKCCLNCFFLICCQSCMYCLIVWSCLLVDAIDIFM